MLHGVERFYCDCAMSVQGPQMKSQANQILAHLQSGNSITPIDALNLFDSFRLSARIKDLRRLGHDIKTTRIQVPSGKFVASYRLAV